MKCINPKSADHFFHFGNHFVLLINYMQRLQLETVKVWTTALITKIKDRNLSKFSIWKKFYLIIPCSYQFLGGKAWWWLDMPLPHKNSCTCPVWTLSRPLYRYLMINTIRFYSKKINVVSDGNDQYHQKL